MDDKNKMNIKDYIKWGFICVAVGLAFLAVGVWMLSDGSTFLGLLEIVGSIAAFVFSFVMFKNTAIKIKEEITDNQKRKLKIVLVISVCSILVLSAAVVCIMAARSKNTETKSQPIIKALDGTSWNWYGKYGNNWVFHEYYLTEEDILDEKYENRNWEVIRVQDDVMTISVDGYRVTFEVFYTVENGVYTIDMLRNQHYGSSEYEYAERLKDHSVLAEEFDAFKSEAFAGHNPMKMIEYIEWVKANSEDLGIPIIECFPYQEMRTYFETHGTKLITKTGENGYYDAIQDEFVNESYWYSPLDGKKVSRGDIGRYKYTKEYSFYGDFMMQSVSKVWYEAGPNEYDSYLYFKDEMILNDNGGSPFDMICIFEMTDHVYLVEAEDDLMIVALEEDAITLIHDFEMVTIAYE